MLRLISSRLAALPPTKTATAAAAVATTADATEDLLRSIGYEDKFDAPPRSKIVTLRVPHVTTATPLVRDPQARRRLTSKHNPHARQLEEKLQPPTLPNGAATLKADLTKHFIGGVNTVPSSSSASSSSVVASTASTVSDKFAIVTVNNLQYKVSAGDIIAAQRISAAVGSRIALKKVNMVGGQRFTAIGRPLLSSARVVAEVEEHKRMKGVLGYTAYKGRHHNRFTFNEHAVTMLRIIEVSYDPVIVGELDRRSGILLPEEKRVSDVEGPMHNCYYADEAPAKEGVVNSK